MAITSLRRTFIPLTTRRGIVALHIVSAVFFLTTLRLGWQSLQEELAYRKDFVEDYLAGKAIAAGLSPYTPLPQLKDRFQPESNANIFPHPIPHPPFFILLVSPLSFLDFRLAAGLWLVVELSAFTSAILLLAKGTAIERSPFKLPLLFTLLGCRPIQVSVVLGQAAPLLLLLSVLLLNELRRSNDTLAGIYLGLLMAIKLFGTPLLIYFLLRKNLKAVFATILTFGLSNLFCVVALGPRNLMVYYREVMPFVPGQYQADMNNLSLWTIPQRLFGGLYPTVQAAPTAPPLLVNMSWIVPAAAPLFALGLLGITLFYSLRVKNQNLAAILLLTFGVIFSPLAWIHNFVMLVIPLFFSWQLLARSGFPSIPTLFTILLSVLAYLGELVGPALFHSVPKINRVESLIALTPIFVLLSIMLLAGLLSARIVTPRNYAAVE